MNACLARQPVSAVPTWAVAGCASLALLFLYPWQHPLPAAAVGVVVFGMVQVVFPNCRPVHALPLCPWNWTLAVFGFKLVVLPLLEVLAGVQIGELPRLPSDLNINLALLLDAGTFVALAIAYSLCQSRRAASPDAQSSLVWFVPRWLVVIYLGIGLAGLWLFFNDMERLIMYYREPAAYLLLNSGPDSDSNWGVGASTFLRPFLGFAFVLMLCRLLDSTRPRHPLLKWLAASTLICMAAVSFSVFTYNRGAFAAPLLAICAVLLTRARRHGLRLIVVAAVAGGALLMMNTIYRASHGRTDLSSSADEWRTVASDLPGLSLVQVYGNGPQFLGFLLEEAEQRELDWGRILVSDIMSAVPVLGKPFRDGTGNAFYNGLLNRGNAEDQIVPFAGELFLSFHVVGVVVGFALLGAIICRLQNAFARSRTSLPMYVIQLTTIWLVFLVVGSLSVVSQIAIYFYWPIFLYFMVAKRTARV
jgi:hypothetical protein